MAPACAQGVSKHLARSFRLARSWADFISTHATSPAGISPVVPGFGEFGSWLLVLLYFAPRSRPKPANKRVGTTCLDLDLSNAESLRSAEFEILFET